MKKEMQIKITLNKKEDYKNSFNEKELSENLSNYIYESCRGKEPTVVPTLLITTKFKMNEEERETLISMIRKNFGLKIQEEEINLKYSIWWKNIMFLIGVILLAISYLLEQLHGYITSQVVLILAWVMIWEVVYAYFFENVKKKVKIKRLKQLTIAPITIREEIKNEKSRSKTNLSSL